MYSAFILQEAFSFYMVSNLQASWISKEKKGMKSIKNYS